MKFHMFDRRSAERFAELLDDTSGSRRHHERAPADDRLAELVAIGSSLSAARPGARVDPEFRTGLRAMLVATAERDGIGRTAAAVETESATTATKATGLLRGRSGRRLRTRGAIVLGVAAGAMAVSGISAASENATPGDALYGVKRSTERAQLAMAGSDVTRGQLSLDFARTRLAEAASMTGADRGFGGVLDDMDADTRKGVKLLTTSSVAHRDNRPLTTVDEFVTNQRRTLMPALDNLDTDNRERAMGSLSLLDTVEQRTEDLRAGLTCTPATPAGSDLLGPKLRDCKKNADSTATSRPGGHSGTTTPRQKDKDQTLGTDPVRPERTGPSASTSTGADEDDATPAPTRPGRTSTTGPDLLPTGDVTPPVPSIAPTVPAPATNEDKGVVGGLLNGIFG